MEPTPILSPGAPFLQLLVTFGLALLLAHLHRRFKKEHFRWWAVALLARTLSVAAIVAFMLTGRGWLLFLHQVFLGWTALGLLYAAEVFSRQLAWERRFILLAAFPLVWSYIAIFVLDRFALAAGPAIVFLSLATGWTGVVFLRYRRRTSSTAAGFLAAVMLLWALHHLDYPILRARGAWDPWGYYLDILFVLAMGAGVLLLVVEEQREGLLTLTALSGDLRAAPTADSHSALLTRPLGLRGVRGAALVTVRGASVSMMRGIGDCAGWQDSTIPDSVRTLAREAATTGRSRLEGATGAAEVAPPFAAALPLGSPTGGDAGGPGGGSTVMVIVGDVAAPFAALDDSILRVVSEQVGHALERAELTDRLASRTEELESLSVRMLQEHEDQRRRIGRELHDETAQVFSALKIQLGLLREDAPDTLNPRFDRLIEWVDRGTGSVRIATDGLRPALLDDLGLLPALRALVADLREWGELSVTFTATDWPTHAKGLVRQDAEVAIFRALQEALSNVARHAQASVAIIELALIGARVHLRVRDDGIGIPEDAMTHFASAPGRSGLIGMRERLASVGGRVTLGAASPRGLVLEIDVPTELS